MTVKSFLYLDEYKMYSVSSQIFEGLTDRVVRHSETDKIEQEEQRGPFASGRIMADIATARSGVTEHRFLHDYAYSLFEKRLSEMGSVVELRDHIGGDWRKVASEAGFVKVTGKTLFNDMAQVSKILSQFNDAGQAMTYVKNHETIMTARELKKQLGKIKDRNKRAEIGEIINSADIESMAKNEGLNFDDGFLKNLQYLINFGFSNAFDVRVSLRSEDGEITFSSLLNRKYFREPEWDIVWKHARVPQKEFTVFGVVTQVGQPQDFEKEKDVENSGKQNGEPTSIKEATLNMMEFIVGLEQTFTAPFSNEVMIDPIAVYREI
ncbi:hypothetical protein GAY28_04520 [Azospirillum brasilense]|nr:hypothetical protein [Azospirillum brasilense]